MEMFFEEEIRARHALIARAVRSGPNRRRFPRTTSFFAGLQRPEVVPCPGLSTC